MDEENWHKRNSLGHLEVFISQDLWDRRYPVAWAEEKLISQGCPVIEPLLAVLGDKTQDSNLRCVAARVLACFDDPRFLRILADSGMSEADLIVPVERYLPMPRSVRETTARDLGQWLQSERDSSLEALRLRLLDSAMDARGTNLEWDPRIPLRWLNCLYEKDVDRLLIGASPKALEFRNRELRKGYDPLLVFDRFQAGPPGFISQQGIQSIFGQAEDQIACRELLTHASYLRKQGVPNWDQQLREWYWAHRQLLRYDVEKMRFSIERNRNNTASSSTSE